MIEHDLSIVTAVIITKNTQELYFQVTVKVTMTKIK